MRSCAIMFIGVGRRGCKCPVCVRPVPAIHLRHSINTLCLWTPAAVSGSFPPFRQAGSVWQNLPPFHAAWQWLCVIDSRDTVWIWITVAPRQEWQVKCMWSTGCGRMFPSPRLVPKCLLSQFGRTNLSEKTQQQPLWDVRKGRYCWLTPKLPSMDKCRAQFRQPAVNRGLKTLKVLLSVG